MGVNLVLILDYITISYGGHKDDLIRQMQSFANPNQRDVQNILPVTENLLVVHMKDKKKTTRAKT